MAPNVVKQLTNLLIGKNCLETANETNSSNFNLDYWVSDIDAVLRSNDDIEELIFTNEHCLVARADAHLSIREDLKLSKIDLIEAIRSLATKALSRIDPIFPSCGGQLSRGGHRWHAIIPPAAIDGPILCIRHNQMSKFRADDFQINQQVREAIEGALKERKPIIISGQAGSGKTSLCAALLKELAGSRRTIIIEQYPELPSENPFWTRLTQRPPNLSGKGEIDSAFLIREALRLRPDIIVFGEIRGTEAGALLRCSLSGHQIFATIHASKPNLVIQRLLALAGARDQGIIQLTKILCLHVSQHKSGRQIDWYEHNP
jgi:pilus assembly protein CpaF